MLGDGIKRVALLVCNCFASGRTLPVSGLMVSILEELRSILTRDPLQSK